MNLPGFHLRTLRLLAFFVSGLAFWALGMSAHYLHAQTCASYSVVKVDSAGCDPRLFIFRVNGPALPAGTVVRWRYEKSGSPGVFIGPLVTAEIDSLVVEYAAGNYTVELLITLPGQPVCTYSIQVNSPPSANAVVGIVNPQNPGSPQVICNVGETVTLTASSSLPGVTYNWVIDNIFQASGPAVTYVANSPGKKRVVLKTQALCTESIDLPNYFEVFAAPTFSVGTFGGDSAPASIDLYKPGKLKACLAAGPGQTYRVWFAALVQNVGSSPIVSYQWQFNGGIPSSYTGSDPRVPFSISYGSSGTYNVSLTVVTAAGCVYTQNFQQLVELDTPPPVPLNLQTDNPVICVRETAFLTPVGGVPPAGVTVSYVITPQTGATLTLVPALGGVLFRGLQAGTYQVVMQYTKGACEALSPNPLTITVIGSRALFTGKPDSLSACAPPLTVSFSITPTTYLPTAVYTWSILDSANNVLSEITMPIPAPQSYVHTFTQAGVYSVRLSSTSSPSPGFVCTDTLTRLSYVSIKETEASFEYAEGSSNSICLGERTTFRSTVVPEDFPFTRQWFYTSTFQPTFTSFGTGVARQFTPPRIGVYTISHVVNNKGKCADTLTKPAHLIVKGVEGVIKVNQSTDCTAPRTVTAQFISSAVVPQGANLSYEWVVNPANGVTFVSGQNQSTVNLVFTEDGAFSLQCRVALNGSECVQKINAPTQIFVGIEVDVRADTVVCLKTPMLLTAKTRYNPAGGYYWTSSDPLAVFLPSAFAATPQVIFRTPGPQYVICRALAPAPFECTAVDTHRVMVKHVVADFALAPGDTNYKKCQPQTFTFVPNAPGAIEFTWIPEPGIVVPTNAPSYTYTYVRNGVYDVMLIVKNQVGCVDTIIKRNFITVAGPRSAFVSSQDTICGTATVVFTNTSSFSEEGTGIFYPLGLDSIQATMSLQTTASYTYTFPDGVDENAQYVEYYPFLRYFDREGCRDNFGYTDTIRIYRPITAAIYTEAVVACAPNGFMLVDTSRWVKNRYWDVDGNGVPDDSSRSVRVILDTPDSRRTVVLYVDNGFGCFDTTTVELRTFATPLALFTIQDSVGCPGVPVRFTNQLDTSATGVQFIWEFGDQTVSTVYSPEHVYAAAGFYTVRLTVFDDQGCSSVHEKTLNLTIPEPIPDFEPKTAELEFFPFDNEVQFTNRSVEASTWLWDFGDGVTSTELNPKHTYTREDTFFVTLKAFNVAGCVADTTFGPFIVIDKHVYFPNVFTPNGDGQNDRLEVNYKGQKEVLIRLFDRFGNRLPVEIRPGRPGWDGQVNGRNAPDGVYYALIKVGNQEYTKPVMLIR